MATSPGSTVPNPRAITACPPSLNPSTQTYAKGLEMGMEKGMKAAGFGPQIKNYVFSRRPRESPLPAFEFVNEPVKTFAQRLRAPTLCPSFRTEQADFFFPFRSCERVGLRREKSLSSLLLSRERRNCRRTT